MAHSLLWHQNSNRAERVYTSLRLHCKQKCFLPLPLNPLTLVMQEELEALFAQLDKAKGRATGSLGKGELGDALSAFFRVGQPGGKSEERYDELLQALDEDQPGSKVMYKKLFEEDR